MWEEDKEHDILDSRMVLGQFLGNIRKELAKRGTKKETLPWHKLVSEPLSVHTQVQSLEDGLLMIACDHPAYLQLLHIQKRTILKTLRLHYPSLQVMDIKGIVTKDGK